MGSSSSLPSCSVVYSGMFVLKSKPPSISNRMQKFMSLQREGNWLWASIRLFVVAIARKYTQRKRAAQRPKFQRDAQAYIQRRRESSDQREERWLVPPETTLTNLRLLTPAEVQVCCREFY